jgi:protein O-GlcNAc transferase
LAPRTIRETFALALRRHQAGRLEEAERLYRDVLRTAPHHADALHLRGVLALQTGRDGDATALIGKAVAANGNEPTFHNSLGIALQRTGRVDEAVESYRRAIAIQPRCAETHYNLAAALLSRGMHDEAIRACEQVLALNAASPEAHNLMGQALQCLARFDEAAAAHRKALRLRPSYSEAHYNLGTVLQMQEKPDEAAACYRRCLALTPDCAEAHSNLGAIFSAQGRCDDAAASYRQALALKPDYAAAHLGLAIAAIPILTDSIVESAAATERFARALDDLAAWSEAHPGALGRVVGASQPYHLLYRPQDITAPLKRYGAIVSAAAAAHWKPEPPAPPPRQRIRMGVVCGYVQRRHPVWHIVLRGVLAHLDRSRFEVVLYHTGPVKDDETEWARNHVDRFVQGPKATKAWLEDIAADRPDVLFYPEVGMDPATCALAALRLAPLQVVGQGNAMTTGLPTMDIYFSGELMEGQDADRHYCERLVRLPGTGLCLSWNGGAALPWNGPERPTDTVRYALWLQPIKFDPASDGLYARIAKQVGACEFWLPRPPLLSWTADRLRDRMAAAFLAEGLDPKAHLRVGSWLPRDQLSGLFDTMDVYLDSPAFSGCTTAWQAIHRGLPIVTLEGAFLRQRQTAGLLRQIGITEGIAANRDDYVDIAVRWGRESRDPAARAARRDAIRRAAPVVDGNTDAVAMFEQVLVDALRSTALAPAR